VIPTFVLVGPLAVLAALFPAVFGGLALLMKRWMVLLSVACTASTLYFLQAWFLTRLQGTLWGTPQSLWLTFAVMSAVGAAWAGARYRHAVANGQGDVWLLRKFDRVSLVVLSVAGAATLAVVASNGGSLLSSPWLDVLVVSGAVWAGAAFVAFRQPHHAPASAEVVILWALAFGCANAGTLEYGRGASGGFAGGAAAVHDDPLVPKLAGLAWQQPFEAEDRGEFSASPAVTPERIFIAGMHGSGLRNWGVVYAIDPASGGKLWQFDDDGDLKPVFCSPCVAEGKVFIGEGLHTDKTCRLFCLDAATGKKLWEFATESHTESTPCVGDGKVFFGAGDDGLYALDIHTGEKLWQYPVGHIDSNPTFHSGRVYAGSGLSRKNDRKMIFCLDANTGKEVWTHATEYSAYGSPLVTRKHLYCGTGNGNYSVDKPPIAGTVVCLDAATGQQVWERPLPNSVVAKPANDRKNVYVGCRDGSCYALDRKTGEVRWERKMGSPVLAAPAVKLSSESGSGQAVYVASENGLIASLSPATGEPFWQFDLAKHSRLPNVQVMSSPAVSVSREGSVERRRVYFGAKLSGAVGIGSSARLYCLQEEVRLDFDEE
jgi:outer membrane protein assembly factor BamB